MRHLKPMAVIGSFCLLMTGAAHASGFDAYGQAPADLVPVKPRPDMIFELGFGVGTAPVYEGASDYGLTYTPIIGVERLNIPGFIDIGGNPSQGGFKFAPSISVMQERKSADHAPLNGLNDIDATYAIGARVGYEMALTEGFKAEIYGAARYAFGGAEGLVGEAGIDLTAKLTPELTIVGGPVITFAGENYMDKYFGVTATESLATGGRLASFDPGAGFKSAGAKLAVKYEFIPDTFLNLNASYMRYIGDAANSPIVTSGSADAFTVGIGLSRRFTVSY